MSAMTYDTLVASKGAAGSIANFIGYSKIGDEIGPILDRAQALIYMMLRVREMRVEWVFSLSEGESQISLPDRFLEPIGRLHSTDGVYVRHKTEEQVIEATFYESMSGSLGANPFATTSGSQVVTATLTGHGINQGSIITISGASDTGGLDLNGTFEITSIDTDTFTFNASDAASSTATGGGSSATYEGDNITSGLPVAWSVIDERIKFNCAVSENTRFRLAYYRSPALLSSSNQSNFLTKRYPMLIHAACMAAAASFMKDETEHNKHLTSLQALIQNVMIENDMIYRGADLETETP